MAKKKTAVKSPKTGDPKEIKIAVNPNIYPLEAIYGAAYVFLDRAYVFLDGNPKTKIIISIKSKDEESFGKADKIKSEFLNELVNYSLRRQIAERNAKLREYVAGAALLGASGDINVFPVTETDNISPDELPVGAEIEETVIETETWKEDPFQIAVPWEEKYATVSEEAPAAEIKTSAKKTKKTAKKTKKK